MAYELKKTEEQIEKERQEEERLAKYGDHTDELRRDLPTYVDMAAAGTASKKVASSKIGILYKIIGLLLIAGLGFGAYKVVMYLVGSGGQDITSYLNYKESELADYLKLEFKDAPERVKKIQQYSGGTVTVRSAEGLEVIYINGEQVGVATDGRDYRFFDVGINDPEKDALEKMTFKYDSSFNVMNDLMGGSSKSYYYCDTAKNTCFVMTVSDKSNRVVYMSYFTDMKLITKDLSF